MYPYSFLFLFLAAVSFFLGRAHSSVAAIELSKLFLAMFAVFIACVALFRKNRVAR